MCRSPWLGAARKQVRLRLYVVMLASRVQPFCVLTHVFRHQLSRDGKAWQSVGLIRQRPAVRIRLPQPEQAPQGSTRGAKPAAKIGRPRNSSPGLFVRPAVRMLAVSSVGRAPDFDSGCRWFDPTTVCQFQDRWPRGPRQRRAKPWSRKRPAGSNPARSATFLGRLAQRQSTVLIRRGSVVRSHGWLPG